MNIQIQIAQIENGWLVNVPPTVEQIQTMQQEGMQPQPITTFCENYFDVCECLKGAWPKE